MGIKSDNVYKVLSGSCLTNTSSNYHFYYYYPPVCSGSQSWGKKDGALIDLQASKNLKSIMEVGPSRVGHSNQWNSLVLSRDNSEHVLLFPRCGNVVTRTKVTVAFLWLLYLRSILSKDALLK